MNFLNAVARVRQTAAAGFHAGACGRQFRAVKGKLPPTRALPTPVPHSLRPSHRSVVPSDFSNTLSMQGVTHASGDPLRSVCKGL